MKTTSGKGQNIIRENDRKTYAFPGSKRHRVVETTNSTHAPKYWRNVIVTNRDKRNTQRHTGAVTGVFHLAILAIFETHEIWLCFVSALQPRLPAGESTK